MIERKFVEPDEVRALYSEIVPAYQEAFSGDPWYEVGKCVDSLQRCDNGFSALEVGTYCDVCDGCIKQPAYEVDELTAKFDYIGSTRPTQWYIEQSPAGLTLAAIAWQATWRKVKDEKYGTIQPMEQWLMGCLGEEDFIWLDEVFANKSIKSQGNLSNFRYMIEGFAERLGPSRVAYRTKNPAMTRVVERDFYGGSNIYKAFDDVPDQRGFVVIDLGRND